MTVPVYIYPDESVHTEQCLLGPNVVIPLNLMVPHASLVSYPSVPVLPHSQAATTMIQLVKVARIPAHTGMVVDAVMDCPLLPHALLLFEPLEKLHESALIHIQDGIMEQRANGHIQLFLQNTSFECQELLGGM